MVNGSRLNPATACVGFRYEPIRDYPDGEYNIARAYSWYDPAGFEPAIDPVAFRRQHPEIADEDWGQPFTAAFDRGERRFLLRLKEDHPEIFDSAGGRRAACLGYMFGACRPSEETLDEIGIERHD